MGSPFQSIDVYKSFCYGAQVPDRFFQLRSFITWWLDAVDEHALHSPFFYDFYTKVIKPPDTKTRGHSIEKLRDQLVHDSRKIKVLDHGTGKRESTRTVSSIARNSLTPRKYSELYSRIIQHFRCNTIVELGTSLGINTLYLASHKASQVTTFEGAPAIAEIASITMQFAQAKNVKIIAGNIDQTLPSFLQTTKRVDFAFIDANHTYPATMRYFETLVTKTSEASVIILDDIHYSPGMQQAWNAARNNRLVYGSADLYRCGILFFDPSLNKQHVILQC